MHWYRSQNLEEGRKSMQKAINTNGTDSEKAAAALLQPVITSKRAKYVRFDIETALGKEMYICVVDSEKKNRMGYSVSMELQCEEFLAEHCYCDAYELLGVRDCTEEELKLLEQYQNEENMTFWEAQTKVCYPNGDSTNELIYKAARTEDRNMTEREQMVKYLGVDSEDLENPALYQFYKKCMDTGLDVYDADCYAILNTLFGYDVGMENARAINETLWNKNIDTFDISSGSPENRKIVEEAVKELNIDMDFSNWQEGEYKEYSFFPTVAPSKVRR